MHQFKAIIFGLIFVALLPSCKEDEKPDERVSLTIDGFALTSATAPGGRLHTNEEWEHTFGEKLTVFFVSQSTQTNYPFTFVPDFSSDLPEISLPIDTYYYYGTSDATQITSFLPVQIEGYLELSAPTISRLVAKTDYQLVSFSQRNLTEQSRITHPEEGSFFSKDGYFYAYVPSNQLFKAELILPGGNSLQWGLDTKPFVHSSFIFKSPNDTGQIPSMGDPQLTFSQVIVTLDSESVPDRMPPFYQTEIADEVKEASGLQFIGERLFAINDGGNAAEIYEIDQRQGHMIRRIRVSNATNIDWEDLASDGQYLYIGDFGNNLGSRRDLRVLRIPLSEIEFKNDLEAEVIHFTYDRQTAFGSADHRFDCEAMVYHGGQLLLFTKPTNAQGSDVYVLNPTPGTQVAGYAGTFETAGWITGADLTGNGKNLVLSGYEKAGLASQAFIGLVKNPTLPALSGNTVKTIRLGSLVFNSQTEGIAIDGDYRVKIAGEQLNQGGLTVPQRLSELDLKGILAN